MRGLVQIRRVGQIRLSKVRQIQPAKVGQIQPAKVGQIRAAKVGQIRAAKVGQIRAALTKASKISGKTMVGPGINSYSVLDIIAPFRFHDKIIPRYSTLMHYHFGVAQNRRVKIQKKA